jgi:hypothetical protein
MAFGLKRDEVKNWKESVVKGEIAFLTHYWLDERFPSCTTVTKVGCANVEKLIAWGKQYDLRPEWMHNDVRYPHFDLFGDTQKKILKREGMEAHINKFEL